MSDMKDVVIVSAARTPIGSFQGALAPLSAPRLGAIAIKEALARAGISGDALGGIGEVYMGCVLPAGLGQAPARQASIGAGVPDKVGAVTINKVCGSGLKAVVFGANAIAAGEHDIVVAGGLGVPCVLALATATWVWVLPETRGIALPRLSSTAHNDALQ